MICFECSIEGARTEAVAVCPICGAGLCQSHHRANRFVPAPDGRGREPRCRHGVAAVPAGRGDAPSGTRDATH